MTRADIVGEIAKSTRVEKTTVMKVVEAFMESVKSYLTSGENVYLRCFGSYVVHYIMATSLLSSRK